MAQQDFGARRNAAYETVRFACNLFCSGNRDSIESFGTSCICSPFLLPELYGTLSGLWGSSAGGWIAGLYLWMQPDGSPTGGSRRDATVGGAPGAVACGKFVYWD